MQSWTKPCTEQRTQRSVLMLKLRMLCQMGFDTGVFSPCLYHSSAVDTSVFRHGDDFVVSGTRTQQKQFEEQL